MFLSDARHIPDVAAETTAAVIIAISNDVPNALDKNADIANISPDMYPINPSVANTVRTFSFSIKQDIVVNIISSIAVIIHAATGISVNFAVRKARRNIIIPNTPQKNIL